MALFVLQHTEFLPVLSSRSSVTLWLKVSWMCKNGCFMLDISVTLYWVSRPNVAVSTLTDLLLTGNFI